jgi:hypothetical protein
MRDCQRVAGSAWDGLGRLRMLIDSGLRQLGERLIRLLFFAQRRVKQVDGISLNFFITSCPSSMIPVIV